jgi:hypothetical protein
MIMPWFIPLAVLVGIGATRTGLRMRHARRTREEWDWCVLLVLGWFPLACWILAQFVTQD